MSDRAKEPGPRGWYFRSMRHEMQLLAVQCERLLNACEKVNETLEREGGTAADYEQARVLRALAFIKLQLAVEKQDTHWWLL